MPKENRLTRRFAGLASAAGGGAGRGGAHARRAEAACPPLGRFVTVDGLRVHALVEGDGPPVVMIHGVNQTLRDFAFSMTKRLGAAGFRAAALDRPGHGYSDRPTEQGWGLAEQARILRQAARTLGLERPILLGHSLGASVALAWALQAPADVRGLVLASGAYYPFSMRGAPVRIRLFQLARRRLFAAPIAAALRLRIDENDPRDLLKQMFAPNSPPPGYAGFVGAPLLLKTSAVRHNAQDLARLPEGLAAQAEGYPSLTLPTEILHGEADAGFSIEAQAGRLAKALPRARMTVLPKVGHMAHHVAEDALVEAVWRVAAESG